MIWMVIAPLAPVFAYLSPVGKTVWEELGGVLFIGEGVSQWAGFGVSKALPSGCISRYKLLSSDST